MAYPANTEIAIVILAETAAVRKPRRVADQSGSGTTLVCNAHNLAIVW